MKFRPAWFHLKKNSVQSAKFFWKTAKTEKMAFWVVFWFHFRIFCLNSANPAGSRVLEGFFWVPSQLEPLPPWTPTPLPTYRLWVMDNKKTADKRVLGTWSWPLQGPWNLVGGQRFALKDTQAVYFFLHQKAFWPF